MRTPHSDIRQMAAPVFAVAQTHLAHNGINTQWWFSHRHAAARERRVIKELNRLWTAPGQEEAPNRSPVRRFSAGE
jgi:hypothetical protein